MVAEDLNMVGSGAGSVNLDAVEASAPPETILRAARPNGITAKTGAVARRATRSAAGAIRFDLIAAPLAPGEI
jgi:hypothetical protein